MKKLFNSRLFLQVITASIVATAATALIVSAATTIGANITTAGDISMATASSTGTVKFAVINSDTGAISFGDEDLTTTGTLASGALTVTGAASVSTTLSAATTTISAGLIVDTDTLLVDADNNRVGIASSTPNAMLSVGAAPTATSATSTIDFAKPCFKMATEDGTELYLYLKLNSNAYSNWATSTTSCF
ncbi:MAG: hypothetical protein Q8O93_03790 [bacterium]|nr:hypothetical protein [bacterium]